MSGSWFVAVVFIWHLFLWYVFLCGDGHLWQAVLGWRCGLAVVVRIRAALALGLALTPLPQLMRCCASPVAAQLLTPQLHPSLPATLQPLTSGCSTSS